MEGRGGCCIARYAGGVYDMSKIDRIMMRFRPIAPKPVTSGSVSGGSSPEASETSPKSGRGKRKYRNNTKSNGSSRRCNNGINNRKRKAVNEEKVEAVVTLPLLPETPDRKSPPPGRDAAVEVVSSKQVKNLPMRLSFDNNVKDHGSFGTSSVNRKAGVPFMRSVVESSVTVETVTDTWVDFDGLGCTDKERMINLARDTCPGFISDGFGRVTWTNEAYRNMVAGGDDDGVEMVVWLAMKEIVRPPWASFDRAFTCRVRVQYDKKGGNERSSITVPCDVWRIESGGFAWRLDVKAALCLGR